MDELGREDLTAARPVAEALGDDDRRPEEVAFGPHGLADVKPDADPEGSAGKRRLCRCAASCTATAHATASTALPKTTISLCRRGS